MCGRPVIPPYVDYEIALLSGGFRFRGRGDASRMAVNARAVLSPPCTLT